MRLPRPSLRHPRCPPPPRRGEPGVGSLAPCSGRSAPVPCAAISPAGGGGGAGPRPGHRGEWLMRMLLTAATLVAALGLAAGEAAAETKKIDLRTAEGVKAVQGQWRYADVKIVEVDGTGPPP